MDLGTVVGLSISLVAILGSILVGAPLTIFIDVPSVLVVGLGCCGVTLMKWPMENVVGIMERWLRGGWGCKSRNNQDS